MEQVMGEAGQAGAPGGAGAQGSGTMGTGMPGTGQPGGSPAGDPTAAPGAYGTRAGQPAGSGGNGPLTPAEQVAILDGELERGTGVFDAMILEEQAEQRRSSRERPPPPSQAESEPAGGGGQSPYDGGMADAGEYSTGGGMGGVSGPASGGMPKNPAKYPPPKDIPAGDDDDVVARQLREAAMREPDPAIREKLWDEYRKYKGINP